MRYTLHNPKTGRQTSRGYVVCYVDGKQKSVHRVIWELFNGPIPNGMEIDHINGIRDDNRIENLRLATKSQNQYNTAPRNPESGFKGISLNKRINKYVGRLQVKGKVVCTKYFASAQDCHQAYLELVKVHCDNFYRVA